MKKAIVSFALVLVLSMSSFAGNKEKNERREKCEFPCEQMVKDLNLSEKQLSQLKEADKTFDTEVKAIREKKKEFEKSNRESMKAAKVRRDSTFKSILTSIFSIWNRKWHDWKNEQPAILGVKDLGLHLWGKI